VDSQDAETYLRLLGETELRRARAGGPDAAAGRGGRMRDVASAFAWTGVLDRELAVAIVDGYDAALDARLTAPYDSLWRPLGAPAAHLWRREREMYPGSVPPGVLGDVGPVTGTPGGQVVVPGGQADVHVLAVIRTPTRTLLSVAVHTRHGAGGPPRRRVPGTAPRPRGGAGQAGFPPSLTATDADGWAANSSVRVDVAADPAFT